MRLDTLLTCITDTKHHLGLLCTAGAQMHCEALLLQHLCASGDCWAWGMISAATCCAQRLLAWLLQTWMAEMAYDTVVLSYNRYGARIILVHQVYYNALQDAIIEGLKQLQATEQQEGSPAVQQT